MTPMRGKQMYGVVLLAALAMLAFVLAATSAPLRACPGEHCPKTLP